MAKKLTQKEFEEMYERAAEEFSPSLVEPNQLLTASDDPFYVAQRWFHSEFVKQKRGNNEK